ncbi:MAG: D-proline reductase (dithiol) proprotein PrdA, partial [Clostridia bacterium]|nr:D-proline reductase (dithiol) proprotein PrdA [Clostridia bacterium]
YLNGGILTMSITAETAAAHKNDPAVLCCRAEAGTKLEPANFEDPAIFPDLIDTGLLNVDGALKLGQVLNGSTLTKTVDSLTPITPDIVDKYDDDVADEAEAATEDAAEEETAVAPTVGGTVSNVSMKAVGGVLKLYIGEGKDIAIEFPL